MPRKLKENVKNMEIKKLMKILKPFKKKNDLFDIILYGSAVKGAYKARDLDIVIIFRFGSLRSRLAVVQDVKKKMKSFGTVDCKGILWEELFDKANFARVGILLEGISLIDGKAFSQKIGFVGSVLFVYNLRDKSHAQKVNFNYVLAGRNGKGMIEQLLGRHVAPGVVEIPVQYSLEFEDVLKLHRINYHAKRVLVEK
jgi:predicted nucleotidyltransferase